MDSIHPPVYSSSNDAPPSASPPSPPPLPLVISHDGAPTPSINYHPNPNPTSNSNISNGNDDRSRTRSTTALTLSTPFLINIAPLPNHVDFLHGYLGLEGTTPTTQTNASLQGEVQLKFNRPHQVDSIGPSKLEIRFRGIEKRQRRRKKTPATSDNNEDEVIEAGTIENDFTEIELVDQVQTLWTIENDALARVGTTTTESDAPPSSIPFKFDMTQDLPHCIHLSESGLEYSLTATLHFHSGGADATLTPIVQYVPIHLTRTSKPGSTPLVDEQPFASTSMSVSDPIQMSARLSKATYKRSEPIELLVKIQVPDIDSVTKGLRLKAVSAQLVRKITLVGLDDESRVQSTRDEQEGSRSTGKRRQNASETHSHPIQDRKDGEIEVERIETVDENGPEPDNCEPGSTNSDVLTTVMAVSGKSARFSSTRPIVIRLKLHPPTNVSCESITQSTILHQITFSVVVNIGLFTNRKQTDVVVSRDVSIIPDSPPSPASIRSEKQRLVAESSQHFEVATPNWMPSDGPVPAYHELADEVGSSSTSPPPPVLLVESSTLRPSWSGSSFDEEEYDGYEEVSEPLSHRAPPPTIDEDVSPPSHEDHKDLPLMAASSDSSESVLHEAHQERDADEEGGLLTPPPDAYADFFEPVDHALLARRRPLDDSDNEEDQQHPPHPNYAEATSSTTPSSRGLSEPPSPSILTQDSMTCSADGSLIQQPLPPLALLEEQSPPPYVGESSSTTHRPAPFISRSSGARLTSARLPTSHDPHVLDRQHNATSPSLDSQPPSQHENIGPRSHTSRSRMGIEGGRNSITATNTDRSSNALAAPISSNPQSRPPPPSYTSHQDVVLRLNEQGELVRLVRDVEGVI